MTIYPIKTLKMMMRNTNRCCKTISVLPEALVLFVQFDGNLISINGVSIIPLIHFYQTNVHCKIEEN